jgi:hypothetical protein
MHGDPGEGGQDPELSERGQVPPTRSTYCSPVSNLRRNLGVA